MPFVGAMLWAVHRHTSSSVKHNVESRDDIAVILATSGRSEGRADMKVGSRNARRRMSELNGS